MKWNETVLLLCRFHWSSIAPRLQLVNATCTRTIHTENNENHKWTSNHFGKHFIVSSYLGIWLSPHLGIWLSPQVLHVLISSGNCLLSFLFWINCFEQRDGLPPPKIILRKQLKVAKVVTQITSYTSQNRGSVRLVREMTAFPHNFTNDPFNVSPRPGSITYNRKSFTHCFRLADSYSFIGALTILTTKKIAPHWIDQSVNKYSQQIISEDVMKKS